MYANLVAAVIKFDATPLSAARVVQEPGLLAS